VTPLERAKAGIAQALGVSAAPIEAFALADGRMVPTADLDRAVLQAIREPNERMIEAGRRRGAVLVSSMQPYQARDIFADMIDAALEEG
jgi:hypothetical protein